MGSGGVSRERGKHRTDPTLPAWPLCSAAVRLLAAGGGVELSRQRKEQSLKFSFLVTVPRPRLPVPACHGEGGALAEGREGLGIQRDPRFPALCSPLGAPLPSGISFPDRPLKGHVLSKLAVSNSQLGPLKPPRPWRRASLAEQQSLSPPGLFLAEQQFPLPGPVLGRGG